MYPYTNGNLPRRLCSLFTCTYSFNVHRYQTRQASQLRLPRTRLNMAKRSSLSVGPIVWNKPGQDIKEKPNVKQFGIALRKFILDQYSAAT